MLYRASRLQTNGRSSSMLLFNRELRTKQHYRHSIANTGQNAICSKRVRRHNLDIGDLVFCVNMKPDELDSNFSAAKLVIIEIKARDTFGLVNVDTATTLRRDAKFCCELLSTIVIRSCFTLRSLPTKDRLAGIIRE